MEIFSLVMATEQGLVALSSVTLAVGMLAGTISLLAYKANQLTPQQ